MPNSSRKITNAAIALATTYALCLGIPYEALAQAPTPGPVTICFRARTVVIPFYLLTRYIAAGAVANACDTSP